VLTCRSRNRQRGRLLREGGICGSDAEQYEGVIPVRLPVVPGHEPLGVIEWIGDRAAKRWRVDVGDRPPSGRIVRPVPDVSLRTLPCAGAGSSRTAT
jgi:hypothetical protein